MTFKYFLTASVMEMFVVSAAPSFAQGMMDGDMQHNMHDSMSNDMSDTMSNDMMHGDMMMGKGHEKQETEAKGVVHSIDVEKHTINITHEPIPSLKWPSMTMDLPVAQDVDLSDIKPDEEILFHIKLGDDKQYIITKIVEPKDGMMMNHDDMDMMKHNNGKSESKK